MTVRSWCRFQGRDPGFLISRIIRKTSSLMTEFSAAGSGAMADYWEPLIADAIDEHGWAIWPPIPLRLHDQNPLASRSGPTPPADLGCSTMAQCEPVADAHRRQHLPDRSEWNWLGTG